MKEEVKALRVNIDGLAQLVSELRSIKLQVDSDKPILVVSKQTEEATKSLYFAKAWLGKMLGELDSENPYKNGYKTVEDIEPTADVCIFNTDYKNNILSKEGEMLRCEFFVDWENNKTHIEKVDWLRTEINKLDELLMTMSYDGQLTSSDFMRLCYNNSRTYLCEARFNLGFELERIKNN